MAYFFSEPSRTFSEYLLVPGYSSADCIPANVSLKTPVVKYRKGEEECPLTMNIPMVSAVMQSVSGEKMGIGLAKEGGIAFIFVSQPIEQQAEMVRKVKAHKAGFVTSDSNLRLTDTLADVLMLKEQTGHSTMAVTDDGTGTGKLLGIVTSRVYRVIRMDPATPVSAFMTPAEKIISAPEGTSLKAANDIIWDHKLNALPILTEEAAWSPSSSARITTPTRTTPWSCWTPRSAMWWAPASTPATMPSAFPLWWRPAQTFWCWIPPRATPRGRPGPSRGSVTTTATP